MDYWSCELPWRTTNGDLPINYCEIVTGEGLQFSDYCEVATKEEQTDCGTNARVDLHMGG